MLTTTGLRLVLTRKQRTSVTQLTPTASSRLSPAFRAPLLFTPLCFAARLASRTVASISNAPLTAVFAIEQPAIPAIARWRWCRHSPSAMGGRAVDKAEEDHCTNLLRSGQAQFWSADLSQRHRIACHRHFERLHPCLRLPAGTQVHHRTGYKRYELDT